MNAPKKLALILSAVAMALPQTASAKSAALSKAWAGTWYLDTAKSKFSSAEFTSKSDTRTYTVAGPRLTMRSTMIDAAGKTIKWSYSGTRTAKGIEVRQSEPDIIARPSQPRELRPDDAKGKPRRIDRKFSENGKSDAQRVHSDARASHDDIMVSTALVLKRERQKRWN